MGDALNWILAHGAEVVTGLVALNAGLALLVRLTPTPKDDAFVAKAQAWLERALSLFAKPKLSK